MKSNYMEILFILLFLLTCFVAGNAILSYNPNLGKKIIPAWEVSERLVALEAKVASLSLYIKAEREK